jgi:hypothetical protein
MARISCQKEDLYHAKDLTGETVISTASSKKLATIVAHSFDCLPGHVQITSRNGIGSNARVAIQRAVESIFLSPLLHGKRVHSFKMSVVIDTPKAVEVKS